MANTKEHYERVLSPVYSWMYGGFPAALERNTAFFARHALAPARSGLAVDLGAGSGFQSIPLARAGFSVTAIDFDGSLLDELRTHAADLPIRTIEDDLRTFRDHVTERVELIVCMTDTVLHLESREDVERLIADAHAALEPGGAFVVTFRDLSNELSELDRFLPVRSDADTIFTCFLEYEPETVKVHDLVYRRRDGEWSFTKSFYRKLRLSGQWLTDEMTKAGFAFVQTDAAAGLLTIIARRSG